MRAKENNESYSPFAISVKEHSSSLESNLISPHCIRPVMLPSRAADEPLEVPSLLKSAASGAMLSLIAGIGD